jgi:tetratricopeptide (TPR) repeat protein
MKSTGIILIVALLGAGGIYLGIKRNEARILSAEAEKANENFAKAIADCDKTLELDAKYADAYFIRGVAAQYQGDWNAGIEAFTKCVELAPEHAEAYHRRGEIYDHTGDTEHATVDLKKAAELGYRDADGESESAAQEDADESQTVEERE